MANSIRGALLSCAVLGALVIPAQADAIIITYINAGPDDGTVVVGFDNDSSGYTTSDLVQDPFAYSRADTAYGPLPPPGNLPSFDAKTDARSEFGTNLNCATCTGVRTAFGPFNIGIFSNEAGGQTLQPSGAYTSHSYLYSAQSASSTMAPWIIRIDPSVGEVPGTLVTVTIDASLDGQLDVAGVSSADAFWNVSTTSYGSVINGAVSSSTPGTQVFSDSGQLQFTTTIGSTFELVVEHDLNASGSGAGAASRAAVHQALVEISAAPGPPMLLAAQLAADFPTATGVQWRLNNAGDRWIADCEIDGRINALTYALNGALKRRVEHITEAEFPAAVLDALAAQYPGYAIRRERRWETYRNSGDIIEYRARLKQGANDIIDVRLDELGVVTLETINAP